MYIIYIYIYTHKYTYIYIYIYISSCRGPHRETPPPEIRFSKFNKFKISCVLSSKCLHLILQMQNTTIYSNYWRWGLAVWPLLFFSSLCSPPRDVRVRRATNLRSHRLRPISVLRFRNSEGLTQALS